MAHGGYGVMVAQEPVKLLERVQIPLATFAWVIHIHKGEPRLSLSHKILPMTPEERFQKDLRWVLQEIKTELLATPNGKPVEFRIRIQKDKRKIDDPTPSPDTQRKLLKKLEELKVLKIKIHSTYVPDLFARPIEFLLTINHTKFDTLYNSYENKAEQNIAINVDFLKNQRTPKEIKKSLERRFHALVEYKNNIFHYAAAEMDYIDFIGTNKKIGEIIEQLAFEGRVGLPTLQHVSIIFFLESIRLYDLSNPGAEKHPHKIIMPSFLTQKIEERFDLLKSFKNMLRETFAEDEERRRHGLPVITDETAPPTLSSAEHFHKMHLLHNHILEKLEEQKPIAPHDNESKTNQKQSYKISVKDREIWVNEYLIAKPYATGSNFEFFEYVRSQTSNQPILRTQLPESFGSASLKEQMKNKRFFNILNGLGFKDEIKKAFFYKVNSDSLYYRGDEVTTDGLKEAGVKISIFLKELEVAHLKNSPK